MPNDGWSLPIPAAPRRLTREELMAAASARDLLDALRDHESLLTIRRHSRNTEWELTPKMSAVLCAVINNFLTDLGLVP